MKKPLIVLGMALLAFCLFQLGRYSSPATFDSAPSVSSNSVQSLFALRLSDSQGQTQALSQWQGRHLVVNFWATWCPPCREEMPMFSRMNKVYAERNVQFLGLAIDDAEKVRQFAINYPVTYPLLTGGNELNEISRQLGNSRMALPFTVIISPRGELLHSKLGRISEAEMQGLIESTLEAKR